MKLLHYTKDGGDGGEYLVIVEYDESANWQEPGYDLVGSYEITLEPRPHFLPTDRVLVVEV